MGCSDVYYHPEKYGLELIDTLEEADLSWEFHILAAWKDIDSGRVFYAEDSGCSCPSPFEDHTFDSPDNNELTELTKHTFDAFERQVQNFPASYLQRLRFIDSVKEQL